MQKNVLYDVRAVVHVVRIKAPVRSTKAWNRVASYVSLDRASVDIPLPRRSHLRHHPGEDYYAWIPVNSKLSVAIEYLWETSSWVATRGKSRIPLVRFVVRGGIDSKRQGRAEDLVCLCVAVRFRAVEGTGVESPLTTQTSLVRSIERSINVMIKARTETPEIVNATAGV